MQVYILGENDLLQNDSFRLQEQQGLIPVAHILC